MYDSDNESSLEEESQFAIIKPTRPPPNLKSHCSELIQQCYRLKDQILHHKLKKTAEKIVQICHYNLDQKFGMIFAIKFKLHQEKDLDFFIKLLTDEFITVEDKRVQNIRANIKNKEYKSPVRVVHLQEIQIRDLVLKMYMLLDAAEQEKLKEKQSYLMKVKQKKMKNQQIEVRPKDKYEELQKQENKEIEENIGEIKEPITIFVALKVTDLSLNNIYCFEKGLKGKRFVAVIPTFEDLENDASQYSEGISYEKYHMNLYNAKELFCDFMYSCLTSQKIKAYLPTQILSLISDFDFYPLSYEENTRRFLYCFERFYILNKNENQFVNFEGIVELIEKVLEKKFKQFLDYKNNSDKMLKVILDEEEEYKISDKHLNLLLQFQNLKSQEDMINEIRSSIERKLSKNPLLKNYISFLHQKDQPQKNQVRRLRKTRSEMLGISFKKNLTPKHVLEDQITKIFKYATVSIRKQALGVKWEDISLSMRIRPEIPYLTICGIEHDPKHKTLLNDVLSHQSVPLVRLMSKFGGAQKIGELMFLIRNLQICGVIQNNKKMLKLSICTNYFDKANFSSFKRK